MRYWIRVMQNPVLNEVKQDQVELGPTGLVGGVKSGSRGTPVTCGAPRSSCDPHEVSRLHQWQSRRTFGWVRIRIPSFTQPVNILYIYIYILCKPFIVPVLPFDPVRARTRC